METLAQKAQRLGIKPAGSPVSTSSTLLQRAQSLGIKPATQPTITPQQPGLLQGLTQAVVSPFAKLAVTGTSIAGNTIGVAKSLFQKATGDTAGAQATLDLLQQKNQQMQDQGANLGYLGTYKPLQGTKPLEAAGVGAEIGSYGIGALGTAKTIATGLGGKVLQGAGQGALTGLATGGVTSFGQALQEAEVKPADVAYKTLFGAASGAAVGGVLGAITPLVVKAVDKYKGITYVKRIKTIDEANNEIAKLNTEIFKPTPSQLQKFGKISPIKTYTEIMGTELPAVDANNRFIKESVDEIAQKIDDVYRPAAEGFNALLRNSPEVNSLSQTEKLAREKLSQYFNLTPSQTKKALQKIAAEFADIKESTIAKGLLLGDDNIQVAVSDNLKDAFWGATKNFGTEDATISNAVNSSIGHAFKDSIESSVKDVNVKAFNQKLQNLILARDYVTTLAGKQAGTGGKMTKLIAGRLAGTVAGSNFGLPGAIAGNITGDKLVKFMMDPNMQPYRWVLNKKLQSLPKNEAADIVAYVNTLIKQQMDKRINFIAKYSLPPAAQSTMGNAIPNVINASAPTVNTIEKAAPLIMNQSMRTAPTNLLTERASPILLTGRASPIVTPTGISNLGGMTVVRGAGQGALKGELVKTPTNIVQRALSEASDTLNDPAIVQLIKENLDDYLKQISTNAYDALVVDGFTKEAKQFANAMSKIKTLEGLRALMKQFGL